MIVDRLFAWLRSKPFFLRLTLFTRILLAAGFMPTGWVKMMGHRFTTMAVETPIGGFFEAMYQTGYYWRFLGASQVLAGVLLLIPRFAHLGAALFVPIMVNIFVITVSLGFGGTPFVTALMLLAVLYLCAWDYDRFRPMFTRSVLLPEFQPQQLRLDKWERVGFCGFALSLVMFFLISRSLGSARLVLPSIAIGFVAGLFTLVRFVTHGRRLVGRRS